MHHDATAAYALQAAPMTARTMNSSMAWTDERRVRAWTGPSNVEREISPVEHAREPLHLEAHAEVLGHAVRTWRAKHASA